MNANCGAVAAVHQAAHGDIGVCGIGFNINPVALLRNQRAPGDQINGRCAVVYASNRVMEVNSIVFTGDMIDVNVDQVLPSVACEIRVIPSPLLALIWPTTVR